MPFSNTQLLFLLNVESFGGTVTENSVWYDNDPPSLVEQARPITWNKTKKRHTANKPALIQAAVACGLRTIGGTSHAMMITIQPPIGKKGGCL